MSFQFAELAKTASADGVISSDELLALRQLGWGDGEIHRGEAEAIFAINHALTAPDDAWVDFFVEAIGEFVLNGSEPRGYVDQEEAEWLIASLDQDGRLETMAELELLARIMERAGNVPDTLKHYALKHIEAAVLTGEGPTRCGGELSAHQITSAECALIRRFIFSSGGHGPAAVSRFDAEMLFRLKDDTSGQNNAAEWQKLFVDGVANYLKGFTLANAQISHERRKELEAFVADGSANVGRFFRRMATEAPNVRNNFGVVFGKKSTGPSIADRAAEGDEVTSNERKWLDGQIENDGQVDALERALLDRIAADLA